LAKAELEHSDSTMNLLRLKDIFFTLAHGCLQTGLRTGPVS